MIINMNLMEKNTLRNKGYGCEMLKIAMKYAFEIAKADAVQINVFPENPGDQTILRRLYE